MCSKRGIYIFRVSKEKVVVGQRQAQLDVGQDQVAYTTVCNRNIDPHNIGKKCSSKQFYLNIIWLNCSYFRATHWSQGRKLSRGRCAEATRKRYK